MGVIANQIDHIAFVLDKSYSMDGLRARLIKETNNQIAYLKQRSADLGREIRVSVYTFDEHTECVIFDMDVFRVPSVADLYQIGGNTALVDATMKAQEDLRQTATMYGDHGFLTYVLSDGQDNRSQRRREMPSFMANLKPNETIALLAPDQRAVFDAKTYGFPIGNIAIWDTMSATGLEQAGDKIRAATEGYLQGRQVGRASTRTLFSTGADAVNATTVKANLTPLAGDKYRIIPVMPDGVTAETKVRVDKFIKEDCGMPFRLGTVYYQWMKREKIQSQKRLAVVNNKTDKVYVGTGDEIRSMIGLPPVIDGKLAPQFNKDWTIFVQSTAPNRNLVPFTKVLVMV